PDTTLFRALVAALGILGAGGALVPVNTRFKAKEAGFVLQRSGARAVFTVGEFLGANYAAMVADLRPQLANLSLVVGLDGAAHADHSLASFVRLGDPVDE